MKLKPAKPRKDRRNSVLSETELGQLEKLLSKVLTPAAGEAPPASEAPPARPCEARTLSSYGFVERAVAVCAPRYAPASGKHRASRWGLTNGGHTPATGVDR